MPVKNKTFSFILAGGLLAIGVLSLIIFQMSGRHDSDLDAWLNSDGGGGAGKQTLVVGQDLVAGQELVDFHQFVLMLSGDRQLLRTSLAIIDRRWDVSYVPMLLEVGRFLPGDQRSQVVSLIEAKTGQKFGGDFDKWLQWSWQQDFTPHPSYGKFKSAVYSAIDPSFAEYFAQPENPQIRLDEIRWGGVRRDGIPPLKNPKMLAAGEANYLADTDVVFGIELNGDARAYPKRILAWHEMFKDTIGGESVCGVY